MRKEVWQKDWARWESYRFSECTFLCAQKMPSKEKYFPGQESPQVSTKALPGHLSLCASQHTASPPAPQKLLLLEPWAKALFSGPLPARWLQPEHHKFLCHCTCHNSTKTSFPWKGTWQATVCRSFLIYSPALSHDYLKSMAITEG